MNELSYAQMGGLGHLSAAQTRTDFNVKYEVNDVADCHCGATVL